MQPEAGHSASHFPALGGDLGARGPSIALLRRRKYGLTRMPNRAAPATVRITRSLLSIVVITANGSSPLLVHDRRAHAAAVAGIGPRGVDRSVGPLEHAGARAVPDESFAGSPLLFDSDAVPAVSEISDAVSQQRGGLGRVAASASLADNLIAAQDNAADADAGEPAAPPSVLAVLSRPFGAFEDDAGYARWLKLSSTAPTQEAAPPVVIAADANEEELRSRAVVARTADLNELDVQAIKAAVSQISEQQADYAEDVHELNASAEADDESEARAARAAAEASAMEVRQHLLIDAAAAFAAQANVDGYAAFALLG